jgi:hypothetical protein
MSQVVEALAISLPRRLVGHELGHSSDYCPRERLRRCIQSRVILRQREIIRELVGLCIESCER